MSGSQHPYQMSGTGMMRPQYGSPTNMGMMGNLGQMNQMSGMMPQQGMMQQQQFPNQQQNQGFHQQQMMQQHQFPTQQQRTALPQQLMQSPIQQTFQPTFNQQQTPPPSQQQPGMQPQVPTQATMQQQQQQPQPQPPGPQPTPPPQQQPQPSPQHGQAPQQQFPNTNQTQVAAGVMQQQQQQQQQQLAPQPTKEVNTATLCRIGQDAVQEIVSRTQEVFQVLSKLQPPNGTMPSNQMAMERKQKVVELIKSTKIMFKKLRFIYDKCNEGCQELEYTPIESLIPLKDDGDFTRMEEKKNTEAYRTAHEEYRELVQQLLQKNCHMKEIIDQMRMIVWEINTMLALRKP